MTPRSGSSLLQSIALHAAERPALPAIVTADAKLTYAELAAASDSVAKRLRAFGVARESLVALALPRGAAQIVGALGILKSGAAFVPLDPDHPEARLLVEIDDARAAAVVADAHLPGTIARRGLPAVTLAPDGSPLDGGRCAGDEPPLDPDAADLAYVMFTSGSTGRPKGVEITHGNLAHLVAWHCAAFAVTAADRASHLSAVAFDAAVWEVWPYLSAGAAVFVVDDDTARDAEALRDWLVANAISIGFVPTPLAQRLLRLSWPARTALRTMLTGGDVLRARPPSSVPFTLVNNYGPAECTVVTTSGVVAPADGAASTPSIGRPITGVTVTIVDERFEPVPPGQAGEIAIGGDGVGRGYRGRPEWTRERFVTPRHDRGARLYRSGDRGRVLPNGEIAFLGRTDDQLELRGVRIEPGEIENALTAQPGVAESAVVLRATASGDEQLVAYVVLDERAFVTAAQLRDALAARLPRAMLPARFEQLAALPLTRSGKVDREALRERAESAAAEAPFVAPRTPLEDRLAALVAGLLRVDRVSVEDDFFVLGGHSLLGTQLIARIREAEGVRVSLRFLFESPTVAALAVEVERLAGRPQAHASLR